LPLIVVCPKPRSKAGVLILRKSLIFFYQFGAMISAMKRSLFLSAFIFPLFIFFQLEDDFIKWQESRRLAWDDFKAEPMQIGNTAAMTTTHLGFSYKVTNGKVTYTIDCRFEKNKSWGLVKNDWILKHEQGHFDIAEIFARKLNKSINEYQFNKSSFQKDLNDIYKSVVDEKEKFQQQYDDETDYSRNKPKQEEWLKKIEIDLKENKIWEGY